MRLLYLANVRIPTDKAHGLQIMKTCEALSKLGVDVTLAAAERENSILADPFKYYKVQKNFRIRKLPSIDMVKYGPVGFRIQKISYYISAFLHALFAKADVIYTRELVLGALLASVGFRDVVYEDHEPIANRRLYAFLLKKIPKKVLVAAHLQALYKELGLTLEKTVLIPNGVDLEEFANITRDTAIWQKIGIALGTKVVLYVGHLYDWKGVKTLFESVRYLDKTTILICLGGTDGDRKNVQEFVQKKGLKNIIFLPFMPHGDALRHMISADVLVLPNTAKEERSNMYTTPIKLFEYMAAGVPVVASRVPSFEPYLTDGETAILVEPDSPEALAQAVNKILNEAELAKTLANKAQKKVRVYDWSCRSRSIFNFLNQ